MSYLQPQELNGLRGLRFRSQKIMSQILLAPQKGCGEKGLSKGAFLEFILPHLISLPDFVFSEGYVTALREHIGSLDHIFKEDFQSHKNKKYKSEYFRQKDKTLIV